MIVTMITMIVVPGSVNENLAYYHYYHGVIDDHDDLVSSLDSLSRAPLLYVGLLR